RRAWCPPPSADQPVEPVQGETPMTREQLTEKILDIKREKGWSWKQTCDEIGGVSPVLMEERLFNAVPHRGTAMPKPTDPLIYRFCELVMVKGQAWKRLIKEEYGYGIMSAIDFDMEIETGGSLR